MTLNLNDPVGRVLEQLDGVNKSDAGGWTALCPAHNDHAPSLSIGEGEDGRALLHCHAGCPTSEIVNAIGLKPKDLFAQTRESNRELVATYEYTNPIGGPLFYRDRYEWTVDGVRQKAIYPRQLDGTRKGTPPAPYRLHELYAAINSDQTIVLVEGEKSADALRKHGFIATTTGGATSWHKRYVHPFRGARVLLWPDADQPGEQYVADAAADLHTVVTELRVLRIPGHSVGWDAADFFADGGTPEQLRALMVDAPEFSLDRSRQSGKSTAARTLGYWLANPEILLPPATVIPHLVVEGRTTLLSGREKVGKSTLAASAVASVSRGDQFLGVRLPAPVRTLWYAIDERVDDAVRRFEALAADKGNVIINADPRSVDELLAAFELDMAAYRGVRCIVVDTLSRLFAVAHANPNQSQEVEPIMARLVDFSHLHHVALLLLYHTGKGGREYRGSTAIGATVDDILTLRRRGHDEGDGDFDDEGTEDGQRLLEQDGRNLRGRIHVTCLNGIYQIHDGASSVRDRIAAALLEHGTVNTRSELSRLAGARKADGLSAISQMLGEGIVVKHEDGLKLASQNPVGEGSDTGTLGRSREPSNCTTDFGGSVGFPDEGTAREPTQGTESQVQSVAGSALCNAPFSEVGTNQLGADR